MSGEPTTIEDLWNVCFVANNETEALNQAWRQYAPFHDKVIMVSTFTGQTRETGWTEFDLTEPACFRVFGLRDDTEWDNDNMIPEWDLRPLDPDLVVLDLDGKTYRLGDIDYPAYYAPGIGTAEGFGHRDRPLLYPEPLS